MLHYLGVVGARSRLECGCSSVVEHLLAKERVGVRISSSAFLFNNFSLLFRIRFYFFILLFIYLVVVDRFSFSPTVVFVPDLNHFSCPGIVLLADCSFFQQTYLLHFLGGPW